MRTYIIKRLLLCIGILIFVMFLIYLLMRSLPTSYVERVAHERASGMASTSGKIVSYEEWISRLNALYGLDKGVLAGFWGWFTTVLTKGDFGDSWLYNVPVTQKFTEVIWNSVILNIVTLFLEFGIALPLGIIAARKQYSKSDYAISVFALIGISLPGFFFGTVLKLIFSVKLGWLDLYGKTGRYYLTLSTWGQIVDVAKHYIMPVVTLTIISVGGLMRYVRTNMLEVLNADYIRTARAKGLSESRVVNHHAFRNTLIPIVTMVGGMIPGLFTGATITETVFQLPGIGYISYNAMIAGDIPFSMFYMTLGAALTLLGTLIADLLYAVVDPRVRVA